MRDEAGKDMIMRQTSTLKQRAANWRIAMTVGMLRDSLYVHQEGDDWFINYTSTSALAQRNFRIPAGNKTQLDMTDRGGTSVHGSSILTTSWDNAGANIPLHLAKINQARSAQGVGPVRHIHCNSIIWQDVIANDFIAAYAGIANKPYETFAREAGTRPDGSALHEYTGVIACLPGIIWHISDEGLELWNASTDAYVFTRHWPDTMALMMGDPGANLKYTCYLGSEPIAEYDGGPETVRVGISSWSKKTSNPTSTEVYVLDNCLTVPHDPYDLVPGTVVF
jgi:hypothetical protein